MQPAPLSPLRLPAFLFPADPLALDLGYLLRLFVAGWFTFLFLRGRGIAQAGACAGAAAFALTGYLTLHLPMHHLGVEVCLPAACFAVDRALASGTRASLVGVFLVAWSAGVGGNPQATLLLYAFTAALGLGHARRSGIGSLLRVGTAALLGALAASPALLPAVEYIRRSSSPHDHLPGLDHFQPGALLGAFVPGACRASAPPGGVSPYAPFPIGAAVGALAVLGISRRETRLPSRAFAAAALLYLLQAFGAPVVSEAIGGLPLLGETRIYKYGASPFAFAAACLAALGVDRLARARPRAALAAAALVPLELVLAVPRTRPERVEPLTAAPYLDFLRRQEGPFRTFGILGALPPNVNAPFGIEDVRIHEGILDARFDLYRRRFLDRNGLDPFFDGSDIGEWTKADYAAAIAEARRFLSHALLEDAAERTPTALDLASEESMRYFDLLNVRFLLFGPDQFAAARVLAASVPERYRVVHDPGASSADLLVLENLRAYPRAWLVERARAVASPAEAADILAEEAIDLRREAAVEGPALPRPADPPAGPGSGVRFLERGESSSLLEVVAPREGYLVVSETHYPGWRATLDGAPAEILPADVFLRTVRVPPGRHEVRFEFRPASWTGGLLAGALATAVFLGFLAIPRGAAREESPLPPPG
ncbi:MAG: YfhO family protein [Planctomycetes bacterium]|nr:YfhO family protein [Planctomycetota bacterium]